MAAAMANGPIGRSSRPFSWKSGWRSPARRIATDIKVHVCGGVVTHAWVEDKASRAFAAFGPGRQSIARARSGLSPRGSGGARQCAASRLCPSGDLDRPVIAGNLDYIRIDFLVTDDCLYAGEIVVYPGAGYGTTTNPAFAGEIERLWRLDQSAFLRRRHIGRSAPLCRRAPRQMPERYQESLTNDEAATEGERIVVLTEGPCPLAQRRLNSRLATRPTTTSPTAAAAAGWSRAVSRSPCPACVIAGIASPQTPGKARNSSRGGVATVLVIGATPLGHRLAAAPRVPCERAATCFSRSMSERVENDAIMCFLVFRCRRKRNA